MTTPLPLAATAPAISASALPFSFRRDALPHLLVVLGLLLRWVLGRVMRQAASGAFRGGSSAEPAAGPRPAAAPDGQVRVAYVPPRPKRQPRPGGYGGGEYVEFEDVKRA